VKHTRLTFDCFEVLQRLMKCDKTSNSEIKHSVKGENNKTYNLPLTKGIIQDQQRVQNNVQSVELLVDESIILINRVEQKKPTQKKSAKKLIEFKHTAYASDDYMIAQAAWLDAFGNDPLFANCDWEHYRRRIEDHIIENPNFIKANWAVTIRKWISKEYKVRTIGQTNEPKQKQYVNFRERDQQKRDEELKQLYYDLVINPQPATTNDLPF
jgi:hypothetical protein